MGCITSTNNHAVAAEILNEELKFVENEVLGKNNTTIDREEYSDTKARRALQHLSQNLVIENKNRNIREYYDIDKMPTLGSGISGSVRICVHKTTKIQYALKALTKKKIKPEKLAQLKEEIRFMTDLDHPNILRIHEYFETRDVIYLVLELCKGGELLDRLHEQKGHQYSEKIACKYVHTMLSAISYCHSHNIVHRDLKLENFLFEDESPNSELKLIGFIIFFLLKLKFFFIKLNFFFGLL
jgi:calcium-dependent protein kinase